MMTLEELDARHQGEIADYQQERQKRCDALEQQQKELLGGLVYTNAKIHSNLQIMLDEQRQEWEDREKNEIDLLRHIQSLERESLLTSRLNARNWQKRF